MRTSLTSLVFLGAAAMFAADNGVNVERRSPPPARPPELKNEPHGWWSDGRRRVGETTAQPAGKPGWRNLTCGPSPGRGVGVRPHGERALLLKPTWVHPGCVRPSLVRRGRAVLKCFPGAQQALLQMRADAHIVLGLTWPALPSVDRRRDDWPYGDTDDLARTGAGGLGP